MLDIAVEFLVAELLPARHLALENGLEGVGIDRTRKPQFPAPLLAQALASLCAGSFLGAVAILLVAGHALRVRDDHPYGGCCHCLRYPAVTHLPGFSNVHESRIRACGQGTQGEQPNSWTWRRMTVIVTPEAPFRKALARMMFSRVWLAGQQRQPARELNGMPLAMPELCPERRTGMVLIVSLNDTATRKLRFILYNRCRFIEYSHDRTTKHRLTKVPGAGRSGKMLESKEKLVLAMLDWPFLLFVGIGILTYTFKAELKKAISRGRIILVWGDKKFEISELPDQLDESFAPVSDDIDDLKQRIIALEETTRTAKSTDDETPLDEKSVESARQRMLAALEESGYRWRSIERLSSIAGISVAQSSEILRPMQEVVFSRGKSGRTIVRLSSR